jgi:hypothetical protein
MWYSHIGSVILRLSMKHCDIMVWMGFSNIHKSVDRKMICSLIRAVLLPWSRRLLHGVDFMHRKGSPNITCIDQTKNEP